MLKPKTPIIKKDKPTNFIIIQTDKENYYRGKDLQTNIPEKICIII